MSLVFLALSLVEIFQEAQNRWPQVTREVFDRALDEILAERKDLSVQEMRDLLQEKFTNLFDR